MGSLINADSLVPLKFGEKLIIKNFNQFLKVTKSRELNDYWSLLKQVKYLKGSACSSSNSASNGPN